MAFWCTQAKADQDTHFIGQWVICLSFIRRALDGRFLLNQVLRETRP